MKLLTKLTLFITFSKLLIVILFVWLLPSLVSRISFQYTNDDLGQQRKKVMAVIQKNGVDYYLQGDSAYGSYTMLKEEYISLIRLRDQEATDSIETSRRVIEGDTLNYRVLTHVFSSGNQKYLLEIGKTTTTIGQYKKLLQRFTFFILIALIVLSMVVDLLYTNILLRPLSRIVKTKLQGRKFPFREALVPVKTTTLDFKYLDRSLISLMEKIHEAFEKEREFTSNASHELMTPVSILQTNIENMMLDEGMDEVSQEKLSAMLKTLNRLKKIVHALLYISRIDNEQFAKMDIVNVRDLISEIGHDLAHRMEMKSITFTNSVTEKVSVKEVNRDLLFQLFYNLINNATRYNKLGGSIMISDHYSEGEPYRIWIRDTGIGIRTEELGTIFNRFKRSGPGDGEGYGLGLSIVKSIVNYHGAEIKVNSEPGKSSEFIVIFPLR